MQQNSIVKSIEGRVATSSAACGVVGKGAAMMPRFAAFFCRSLFACIRKPNVAKSFSYTNEYTHTDTTHMQHAHATYQVTMHTTHTRKYTQTAQHLVDAFR
jgi:hypothetical protein